MAGVIWRHKRAEHPRWLLQAELCPAPPKIHVEVLSPRTPEYDLNLEIGSLQI